MECLAGEVESLVDEEVECDETLEAGVKEGSE